jgi:hypothetical protein
MNLILYGNFKVFKTSLFSICVIFYFIIYITFLEFEYY